LGLSISAGALDVNLGCSGFVYALGLCDGLIQSGQARTILLLNGDTYSKYIERDDKNSVLIFGDGAAATLVQGRDVERALIGPYMYGTDGNGASYLMLPGSGTRGEHFLGGERSHNKLYMDGNKLFQFAVETVPKCVNALLKKANLKADAIDLFFFHQANDYILDEICRRLGIDRSRAPFDAHHSANTVSATIPIAIRNALDRGEIKDGTVMMLVGFGVGLSWAATIVRWHPLQT
jgi:3-oxoacyl-[acyl-carrier-protein] synthase-3